ncbi:MAG: type II toxin-antitoxin system VapB family antitoxin [Rhizobiaceae bacterium]
MEKAHRQDVTTNRLYVDPSDVYDLLDHTHKVIMRTNIDIDEDLMAEAMRAMGTRTKRETVEKALLAQLAIKRQVGVRTFKGKVDWQGDLDDWRRE